MPGSNSRQLKAGLKSSAVTVEGICSRESATKYTDELGCINSFLVGNGSILLCRMEPWNPEPSKRSLFVRHCSSSVLKRFTLAVELVGYISGRGKHPDDPFGKVGVTGRGKGLTEFQRREKHLHLKGANIEIADGENVET
ncbi:UNVERIFIED_CONTAM: hypothetical protein Scaly_1409700 [Sesamum calycinum]|uniref:Uncharacterized protein n=1 Tax=Sesamum calycinum TaxID=2727403 RepID=A0AAW2PLW1_9LAMI